MRTDTQQPNPSWRLVIADTGDAGTRLPRLRRLLKGMLRGYRFRCLAIAADSPALAEANGKAPPRPAQAPGGLPGQPDTTGSVKRLDDTHIEPEAGPWLMHAPQSFHVKNGTFPMITNKKNLKGA